MRFLTVSLFVVLLADLVSSESTKKLEDKSMKAKSGEEKATTHAAANGTTKVGKSGKEKALTHAAEAGTTKAINTTMKASSGSTPVKAAEAKATTKK
ncbi:hypothetical protein L596_011805 [Steinernema carpocapsae]|uniref:Uncharacterized protein n=1 Tax=Steinernema carpocapsae TaxID=34508 RepID=A0A4U5NW12_STECR|nr:hypothetical protein L596_011805 [Steinernema carpocapsae]